MNCKRI